MKEHHRANAAYLLMDVGNKKSRSILEEIDEFSSPYQGAKKMALKAIRKRLKAQ